jgi:hypothetical protein
VSCRSAPVRGTRLCRVVRGFPTVSPGEWIARRIDRLRVCRHSHEAAPEAAVSKGRPSTRTPINKGSLNKGSPSTAESETPGSAARSVGVVPGCLLSFCPAMRRTPSRVFSSLSRGSSAGPSALYRVRGGGPARPGRP